MGRLLQVSGLRSRVARRLFVLLLLASVVPVSALAVFTYIEVGSALERAAYRRLQQEAKAGGMNLIQRLRWQGDILKRLADRYKGEISASGVPRSVMIPAGFSTLEVGGREMLADLAQEKRDHLSQGGVLLLEQGSHSFMLIALPNSTLLLKANIDPVDIWGDEGTADDYCVLSASGALFYCAPGFDAPTREWSTTVVGQNSGVFPWLVGDEDHFAGYWRGQLMAYFISDGFIIVVSAPRKDTMAALDNFRQIFPAAMVLALALAAWLAITQIRRQMRPLERLEQGTRNLAQGDFRSRVEIAGNDEFAGLAASFNRMASSLDRKFHLLQALGELDRAILTSSQMDYVIDTLLRHVIQALPCDAAGVIHFPANESPRLTMAARDEEVLESTQTSCLTSQLSEEWWQDRAWFAIDLSAPEESCLRNFRNLGATHAIVFPAKVDERLENALILAYRQPPEELDEIVQAGRSLADRLSIAGSSFAWEERLYRQAHYDALTDLPNRVMLRDRMEQALLRAEREKLSVAVMLVDLDDFKQVNDTLGHSAGDQLLLVIAERLRKLARMTDTVARLGGDEFVVLIPDLPRSSAAATADRIANQICTQLAQPATVGSRQVSSPASVGIALFPDNAGNHEELLKTADAAMYESKRNRRGAYQFYSSRMNEAVRERFELAQELRSALEKREFFLVYQPKVDATTHRIVGAEALVRWNSQRRGMVSPAQFIPIVDDIGLGNQLGRWVLETACAQMAAWRNANLPLHSISVNIAAPQFHAGEIIDQVTDVLTSYSLPPHCLELEILESMAVDQSVGVNEILTGLREIGVGIALDDFGTGYSSLVYLTQLPATVLKIDRGFISGLTTDNRRRAIVERIISLAKALGFTVVAEGVEHADQSQVLTAMGCDLFQGFLFSKPLSADDFTALLSTQNRLFSS